VNRGEIWWAALPAPVGSEPGYRRPLLIVQSDAFNRSRIGTVIVAVITSNVRSAEAPGNVALPRRGTGLQKAAVVNVSQLLTLDRTFLVSKIGHVNADQLAAVERGLLCVLGLPMAFIT
jgi:mRNA interferase MazF